MEKWNLVGFARTRIQEQELCQAVTVVIMYLWQLSATISQNAECEQRALSTNLVAIFVNNSNKKIHMPVHLYR